MDNEKTAEKKSKSKWALEMGGKSLFAIIPALAASYFSFSEARLQSNIEIARINAKAGAGYETLVDAVKSLEAERKAHEEESKRLAAYVSRLEVRIDGLLYRVGARVASRPAAVGRVGGSHPPAPAPSEAAPSPSPGTTPSPAAVMLTSPDKLFKTQQAPLKLPKNLEDALEGRAAAK